MGDRRHPTDGSDPAFSPQTTVTTVTYPVMKAFVQAIVDALHGASDKPVTVGGAAIKWAKAWAGVGDFYTFHMYDWINALPVHEIARVVRRDRQAGGAGGVPDSGAHRRALRYAGQHDLSARLRGRDGLVVQRHGFPWAPNDANVQAFATTHPCMFGLPHLELPAGVAFARTAPTLALPRGGPRRGDRNSCGLRGEGPVVGTRAAQNRGECDVIVPRERS